MGGAGEGKAKRRRIRATLLTGIAGGLLGAGLRMARKQARRRRDEGERAFSRASSGIWPPVPPAPARTVRIEAERADGGEVASHGPSDEAEAEATS